MRHSSFVLLAACGLATSLAQAQTPVPRITFNGEVTDQTCKVKINGQSESVVTLHTVKVADFAGNGATTAGLTPFTMNVEGCTPADSGNLDITLQFLGKNVTAGGNLGNSAVSGAENVAVQLLEDATSATPSAITFGSGIVTKTGLLSLPSGESATSHEFAAQYIKESGTVTPGKVTAVVEYTLSYL